MCTGRKMKNFPTAVWFETNDEGKGEILENFQGYLQAANSSMSEKIQDLMLQQSVWFIFKGCFDDGEQFVELGRRSEVEESGKEKIVSDFIDEQIIIISSLLFYRIFFDIVTKEMNDSPDVRRTYFSKSVELGNGFSNNLPIKSVLGKFDKFMIVSVHTVRNLIIANIFIEFVFCSRFVKQLFLQKDFDKNKIDENATISWDG